MIVVIADDLSGATELAAVAHAHGLSAEVQTDFDPTTTARVVAVDTDSRTCSREESDARVRAIAERVVEAQPEWIYKKTDSVLRGHVRSEISELLAITQNKRALFIPANPSRGRVIRDGHYFVEGKPLHETLFANDPDYPATTSNVIELINCEPAVTSIQIPDIESAEDLARVAAFIPPQTLCAGASEFFAALLPAAIREVNWLAPSNQPALYVCGSAAAWPIRRQQCEARSIPLFTNFEIAEVCAAIAKRGAALIAIGDAHGSAREFEGKLSRTTRAILESTRIDRLFLEGGATAAAVLRQLNARRLLVCGQFGKGIASFQIPGRDHFTIAIKPGSYPWPENVWPLQN